MKNNHFSILIYFFFFQFFLLFNISIKSQSVIPVYTPYVDVCQWPPFDITATDSTGVCLYTLAFIVDDQFQEGANPCWGGYSNLDLSWYSEEINTLREKGGDVIISFGGASGIPLAYAASDENELFSAYQTVINAYQLTGIDFDIEGMFVNEPSSIERRSKAMKLLLETFPDLKISLTLPVMPSGLTADGLNVIKQALLHDVDPHVINLMTMDYGVNGDMGNHSIAALNATFTQVKNLYQEQGFAIADSAVWKKLGATPMIGQNDVAGEVFYQDDAVDLRNFAFEKNIGRLSIWSINRDISCVNDNDPLYQCSHIDQDPFEFSNIFQMDGTISYCDGTTSQLELSHFPNETVELYPNPTQENIWINSEAKIIHLWLHDLTGKIILKVNPEKTHLKIDLSRYPKGLYLLSLETSSGWVNKKVIKE
jgi:hypothetical protein